MQETISHRSAEQMSASRDRSGGIWLTQAFSGLILVALLGVHMIVHHFVVEGGLRNFEQVMDYVSNPWVTIVEIAFVIFATVHALLGVRAILMDMRPGPGMLRTINWGLGVFGAVAIVYGIYLALALNRMAG